MENLELNSQKWILIDRSTGKVLSAKDANTEGAVASLAKIITTLIVLENRQLDEDVTVTAEMLQGLEGFAKIGLRANSYKYGFIDRFPEKWAGGSMNEPLNVDASSSTGLYETWHYRYVGTTAATEIATGKYNYGEYDSLEHYLKATGRCKILKTVFAKTNLKL